MERVINFNKWLKELPAEDRHVLDVERRENKKQQQTKMMELAWEAGAQEAFRLVRETSLDLRTI